MLGRILTAFVFVAVATTSAHAKDRDVIGRWKAEIPDQEMIFRSDHTFTKRNGSYTLNGTWRLQGDRLITVGASAVLPERTFDCTYKIRGDTIAFAVCNAVTKSHGKQVGEPELFMTSTSYKRVR